LVQALKVDRARLIRNSQNRFQKNSRDASEVMGHKNSGHFPSVYGSAMDALHPRLEAFAFRTAPVQSDFPAAVIVD